MLEALAELDNKEVFEFMTAISDQQLQELGDSNQLVKPSNIVEILLSSNFVLDCEYFENLFSKITSPLLRQALLFKSCNISHEKLEELSNGSDHIFAIIAQYKLAQKDKHQLSSLINYIECTGPECLTNYLCQSVFTALVIDHTEKIESILQQWLKNINQFDDSEAIPVLTFLLCACHTESAAKAIAEAFCSLPPKAAIKMFGGCSRELFSEEFHYMVMSELKKMRNTVWHDRALMTRWWFFELSEEDNSKDVSRIIVDAVDRASSDYNKGIVNHYLDFVLYCFAQFPSRCGQLLSLLNRDYDLSSLAPFGYCALEASSTFETLKNQLSQRTPEGYKKGLETICQWLASKKKEGKDLFYKPSLEHLAQSVTDYIDSSDAMRDFLTVLWDNVRDYMVKNESHFAETLVRLYHNLFQKTRRRWISAIGDWPIDLTPKNRTIAD